jgi:V/A-type H+-transporting ATPase subunit I
MFSGAALIWTGASAKESSLPLERAGAITMISGTVLILLFSSVKGPLWKRLLMGIKSLARLTSAFGDTLSYGLRLNFMEFFNWSMPEEGYPFMAFERKEKTSWTTISYSR